MRNGISKRILGGIGALTLGLMALAPQTRAAVDVSALPDLSALQPYALFGNYDFLNLANVGTTTVNGNVGISANGQFLMSSPSYIYGRLDLDSGVTTSIANPAHITGGIHQPVSLATAQSQVFSASATLKGLNGGVGDYTLGAVTTAQTFASKGAVTVINMTSLKLGGSANINLSGGANDVFVINISGALDLTGSAGITGVDPSHVLINLYDNTGAMKPGDVIADINTHLMGTVLIPYDGATFHSESGAIFGGTQEITLMSGATVTSVPFTPPSVPDAGATVTLLGLGLGLVGAARKWFY